VRGCEGERVRGCEGERVRGWKGRRARWLRTTHAAAGWLLLVRPSAARRARGWLLTAPPRGRARLWLKDGSDDLEERAHLVRGRGRGRGRGRD